MKVFFSKETFSILKKELNNTVNNIIIVSAFCKKNILSLLEKELPSNVKEKRLLVRFSLSDVLSGATDMELYNLCKEEGWRMYVMFNLHAKTYVFDKKRCILGSANATNKGLGINQNSNIEISSIFDLEPEDLQKIETLFDNAIKMDDLLFAKMYKEYLDAKKDIRGTPTIWSHGILSLMNQKSLSVLFMHEFPQNPFFEDISRNNLDFLELAANSIPDEIKTTFLGCRAFKWLYQELNSTENKQIFFGELTQKLHNRIIKDPPPYRKDVKILLANLLSWVNVFAKDFIEIERPNYSQIIKIKKINIISLEWK